MYSKVVHWVSMPLMHREKAATFKVRPENTEALNLPHKENIKHPQHAYQSYSTLVIYCTSTYKLVVAFTH